MHTPSGKWGFQYTLDGAPDGSHDMYLGWVADPASYTGATHGPNKAAYSMGTHATGGDLYKNGSVVEDGLANFADNDAIEILLDVTNGTCDILRNSVAYGSQITGMTAASYFACIEAYNIGAEFDFGQNGYTPSDGDYLALNTTNIAGSIAADTNVTGSFTGNANVDGAFVYLGYTPDPDGTCTINSNTVTWGTHAFRTINGFKLITSSASYNSSGSNTYDMDVIGPFVDADGRVMAAQSD